MQDWGEVVGKAGREQMKGREEEFPLGGEHAGASWQQKARHARAGKWRKTRRYETGDFVCNAVQCRWSKLTEHRWCAGGGCRGKKTTSRHLTAPIDFLDEISVTLCPSCGSSPVPPLPPSLPQTFFPLSLSLWCVCLCVSPLTLLPCFLYQTSISGLDTYPVLPHHRRSTHTHTLTPRHNTHWGHMQVKQMHA